MSKRKGKRVSAELPADFVRARPWMRRQLGEAPNLALFWRDGPADTRQGMAWALSACATPDCPCRDVFVQAIALQDCVVWVQLTAGKVETGVAPDPKGLAGPHDRRFAYAKVNVVTGSITQENPERGDPEMFAWIKGELTKEAIAALRASWNAARGRPADAAIVPAE